MSLAIVGLRKFWTRTATLVSVLIAVALVAPRVRPGRRQLPQRARPDSGLDKATLNWLLTLPGRLRRRHLARLRLLRTHRR